MTLSLLGYSAAEHLEMLKAHLDVILAVVALASAAGASIAATVKLARFVAPYARTTVLLFDVAEKHFVKKGNGNIVEAVQRIEAQQQTNAGTLTGIADTLEVNGQRARMVDHAARIGIVDIDAAGRIVWANRLYLDLTGMGIEDVAADGWQQTIHPADLPGVLSQWARARAERREITMKYRRILPDGGAILVRTIVKPLVARDEVRGFRATVEMLRRLRDGEVISPPTPRAGFDVADLHGIVGGDQS